MIGEILNHYRILEKIGSGGMGEVYRAADDRLARDVAIKVLKSSFAQDPDRLRRFELEARASAALSHPNIVAIYDIGVHEGCPYIVSELLQGETLRQRVEKGPLSLRQASDYGSQIVRGLIAAHEKRIIHRDLKPENLFITRDGHVKILDFGIAKLTSTEFVENSSIEDLTTQTKAGSVLGTICYMSPEQLRGKAVDHRSDIFSFGAILYEMVTGVRAFKGETEVDTMMAVLQQDPPEMVLAREVVPSAFDQIVRHCLEKEPENRFQSARDLAFALSTVSEGKSKPVAGFRTKKSRLRKWLPWSAAALVLLTAGSILGTRFKKGAEPVTYRRITFQRGTIYSARFSPDSHNILYDALWNGRPAELYTTVGDSPLARPLGFPASHLVALSPSNELALVVRGIPDRGNFVNGVLARAPMAGGTPREILEMVQYADWSPQGELAVVHGAPGESQLEFPIGKVLYQTAGSISNLRFSPDGSRLAFLDHPAAGDDRGSVCVMDLSGKRTKLTSEWKSAEGLAWNPNGKEIWFSAANGGSTVKALWAVTLDGQQRSILTVPGGITLQDIGSDGRVLITINNQRIAMEQTSRGSKDIRDLSWYDWSLVRDISQDGQWVLFEESSAPAGPNYGVVIRKVDGSPPMRLGDGSAGGLSPDGKWAISIYTGTPQHITLYPTGTGEAREVFLPQLEHILNGVAYFLPDGKHIVVRGNLPGRPNRSFLIDLEEKNPAPKPITPEGEFVTLPSPDGKYQVGWLGSNIALFPVAGGSPVRLWPQQKTNAYEVLQWSADSKFLYVGQTEGIPLKIYRAEVATGKMNFIQELMPADRAGVTRISPVVTTSNASEFAYSYLQTLSSLYVVNGLL